MVTAPPNKGFSVKIILAGMVGSRSRAIYASGVYAHQGIMDRRQTLHPTADPVNNARCNPPMSASVVKNTAAMRMSMSRPSVFGLQAGNPRQSILRVGSQNMDPALSSVKKHADLVYGRTPLSIKQYVIGHTCWMDADQYLLALDVRQLVDNPWHPA